MDKNLKHNIKSGILKPCLALLAAIALIFSAPAAHAAEEKKYIKWVDFNVTASAMRDAAAVDTATYGTETHLSWISLLSVLAVRYGGDFKRYKKSDLDAIAAEAIKNGGVTAPKNEKLYRYYMEAYAAVLGGFIGEYTEVSVKNGVEEKHTAYGIRVFSPIAKGYAYSDYDDFGAARNYGYKRRHLGHDMMGGTGTPIIAVESGVVEAIGWNQYGGWRIGIRSLDSKRYYYYAHLRRGHPYPQDLYEGKYVNAGEVIGYLGMTGYSRKEDVNNINVPHLHFGLEVIFAPEQKDGYNQIWVNCYEIAEFLRNSRSAVYRNEGEKDYTARSFRIPSEFPD